MLLEDMRQELIKAALGRRTVTYGYLMRKFGISRGSDPGETVVGALGKIDQREYAVGAPGFAAIVVRKDTGYPGGGFFCWDGVPAELRRPNSEGQKPVLSDAEKEYVNKEREKIWAYYRQHYSTHYDLESFTEDS